MRLKPTASLAALTLLTAVTLPSLGGAAAVAAEQVASVPVAFTVVNSNASALPCASDGKGYTVVGHITGPVSVLEKGTIGAAALYLHGDGVDERLWHYTKTPGHDYVSDMAKAGFVSVTITRLGYEGSGKPNGNDLCFGSEADVAHQIVNQLRRGAYIPTGSVLGSAAGKPPKIARLALAGHSASGFVAMAEAYSFDDIDGLIVVGSGEFPTPHVGTTVLDQQSRCPGSADGYAFLTTDQNQAKADFFTAGADPAVVEDLTATRPKDACGPLFNAPSSFVVDGAMLGSIDVPVLCIAGDRDVFFPRPDWQAKLFTGSPSATAVVLPDTGHAITLEKSAPEFRAAMADWLRAHKFAAK
ncbi:MAG: alpha/beta hydrolase [Sporichthyaceae bacterium]